MKRLLTLKGVLLIAIVVIIAAGGAAYAVDFVFDRAVTAKLNVVIISEQPIEVYEDDGVTVVNEIDFGTIHIPAFGYFQPPAPPVHRVVVKNLSPVAVEVVVNGDGRDDILPVFGPTEADLEPAAQNAFTLQPEGQPGDMMEGWVGVVFQVPVPSAGAKETTIIFRATEAELQPTEAGRIAFTSDRDGNWELYTMNADGTNETRLTNNSYTDFSPNWSPDGREIIFSTLRKFNTLDIWVLDEDGTNEGPSSFTPPRMICLTGLPDGSRIAFHTDRDGWPQVYIMNADGSGLTRVTRSAEHSGGPSWSPDATKLAYDSDSDGNWDIFSINVDGSDVTRLTNDLSRDLRPAWSPANCRC